MQVGILSWMKYAEKTGMDKYTSELIDALIRNGRSSDLTVMHYGSDKYCSAKDVDCSRSPKIPLFSNYMNMPKIVRDSEIDVLHIPAHCYSEIAPFFTCPKTAKVLTVHDLTPMLFPDTHISHLALIWSATLRLIKKRITMVIADSMNTKRDCIKHLEMSEDRIEVVYPGVGPEFVPLVGDRCQFLSRLEIQYGIEGPFILYVGTLEKRKNVSTLVRAYQEVRKTLKDHKLVIVGRKGWKYSDVFEAVDNLGLKEHVHFTGYVPEKDLRLFYGLAGICVYPSIYEGFGLPPLEAMACGCPVITSNTSSLPEVVGDAGILVDPCDSAEIAQSMHEVLTNERYRRELIRKGIERSSHFSWDATAAKTWSVYERSHQDYPL